MRFDPQTNTVPTDAGFEDAGKVKGPHKPRKGGGAAGALILLFVALVGAAAWYVDRSGGLQPALASADIDIPPEVAALLGDRPATTAAATDPPIEPLHFVRRGDAARAAATDDPQAVDGDEGELPAPDRQAFETGKAFLAIGRKEDAIPHLQDAVRLEPDFVEGWYKLGLAAAMTGRNDLAQQAYDALQKLEPSRASMLSSIMRHR